MDFTRFKFALPTTLAVSTFVSASACRDEHTHCVDIEKQKKCEAQSNCEWDAEDGLCKSICGTLETQDDCEAIDGCFWEQYGGSETGTSEGETGEPAGSCHEPFT